MPVDARARGIPRKTPYEWVAFERYRVTRYEGIVPGTITHLPQMGATSLIVVFGNRANDTATGITYGGQSLTAAHSRGIYDRWGYIWYLADITSRTSDELVVSGVADNCSFHIISCVADTGMTLAGTASPGTWAGWTTGQSYQSDITGTTGTYTKMMVSVAVGDTSTQWVWPSPAIYCERLYGTDTYVSSAQQGVDYGGTAVVMGYRGPDATATLSSGFKVNAPSAGRFMFSAMFEW